MPNSLWAALRHTVRSTPSSRCEGRFADLNVCLGLADPGEPSANARETQGFVSRATDAFQNTSRSRGSRHRHPAIEPPVCRREDLDVHTYTHARIRIYIYIYTYINASSPPCYPIFPLKTVPDSQNHTKTNRNRRDH